MKNKSVIATDLDALRQQIDETLSADTVSELNSAKDLLGRVILKFAGETGYSEIVERANLNLQSVKQKLAGKTEQDQPTPEPNNSENEQ